MTVAAIIMEWTRRLDKGDKAKLLTYCDQLIDLKFSEKDFDSFEQDKFKKKDLLRIENLT
jgi:hypothetical protein